MNTKRILISAVTGLILTGSLAFAAQGNDQGRSKTRVRAAKSTATMTTSGNTRAVRTRQITTGRNMGSVRTGRVTTSGNTAIRTRNFSGGSTVFVGSSFGSPYYYGYGYPYYSFGYYPYGYSYGYYPYDYSYGYYSYGRPSYGAYNGSIVIQVQSRLARAGYYHGPIDGVMGPRTHYAIQAYERTHGLRVDGVISGQLLRNMGLRY